MNRFSLFCVCFILCSFDAAFGSEPTQSEIKQFVIDVSLGAEYGSNEKVISRWAVPPTVSVFGATSEQRQVVDEVFKTIAPLLLDSLGEIKMLADNSESAELKIYFGTQAELLEFGDMHNVVYNTNDHGFFWMFWNDNHELTSSLVLLATDRLAKENLRHYAYEEIIQSFGLARDSDMFSNSVFYAKGSYGGNAQFPSPLDLKLLEWLYTELEPGDDMQTVLKKFDATWKN